MGKLLNSGITWSDVTYLLEGLQSIHELTVELTVLIGTPAGSHLLDFTILAWVPAFEAPGTKVIAEVKGSWPDKTHPTFDSCIFNAGYDLDRAIGRHYSQEELPA